MMHAVIVPAYPQMPAAGIMPKSASYMIPATIISTTKYKRHMPMSTSGNAMNHHPLMIEMNNAISISIRNIIDRFMKLFFCFCRS